MTRSSSGRWQLLLTLLLASCSTESNTDGPPKGTTTDAGSDVAADVVAAPYQLTVLDNARIGSDSAAANFQRADGPVEFTTTYAEAKLIVDLESTCFPFEKWQTNPPPAGHNWPADCDAFDRLVSVSLDEPTAPSTDPPALELIRAVTPFGGPLRLEADITDIANARPGTHTLTTHISTWSDAAGQVSGAAGGWNVTVRIELVPGAGRRVLSAQPLFNGNQTKPSPKNTIGFEIPAGTTDARIEYRVTGHGASSSPGCGGPAEEFCVRTHDLYLDGTMVQSLSPWRDDCDALCTIAHQGPQSGGFDYCTENPCGAIASVRAPRANWCPGSMTPPIVVTAPSLLDAGSHDFGWKIADVADGGSWRVSATLYAYGD
jgi:hypothetical protein